MLSICLVYCVSMYIQTEIPAEDKRKPHQMQLTKQINEEARVSISKGQLLLEIEQEHY